MTARNERGFSLVEMLAVLAIIAAAAGVTALSLGGAREGGARAEAERLAATLQRASDEAVITDTPGQLFLDAAGWEVRGIAPPVGGRHALGEDVRLAGAEAIQLGPDAPGAEIALQDRRERWTVRFDGLTAVARREGG